MDDFIEHYLQYMGKTECPTFYHRWCCLSMLGTFLGRQYNTRFGRDTLNTNLYCMLIGIPATRKSTAIKAAKSIIKLAGYTRISADKTSKEKFMLDLAGEDSEDVDTTLDKNLWGNDESSPCEMYIACDEFNDFIGNGNIEFISLLGNLWDFNGPFNNRIKTGKSVSIFDPTISILGGNTPVNFSRAFPPDILGQGFFSRLLLIHGEPTGTKIAWPKEPDDGETNDIVQHLQSIKATVHGRANRTDAAVMLLEKIYYEWAGMDDMRFDSYGGRRFTHLLKLCLITSASAGHTEIGEEDVIYANTILTHTEYLMPKAMGEFGKSKNSDTAHKIMQLLDQAKKAMTVTEIWQELPSELERVGDLADLVRNLVLSRKLIGTPQGFLILKTAIDTMNSDIINYDLLTQEEREMKI